MYKTDWLFEDLLYLKKKKKKSIYKTFINRKKNLSKRKNTS